LWGRSLWLTGAISKISDREEIINRFNSSPDLPVLFLTTGVGGVGITLTGADRVIIYDPSWNPATDAQAVDRAFRVGQVSSPPRSHIRTHARSLSRARTRALSYVRLRSCLGKQEPLSWHSPTLN
jgi:hypothetical protein